MAWNEPGGKRNNSDPWRGSGNDQGPPDLDEFIKKIQSQLSSLFGGKGGGGRGSSSSGGGGAAAWLIVIFVAVVVWGGYGIYRVEQAEQAVVLRFGKYHTVKTAGLHWFPPGIDYMEKFNTQQISSYSHEASMLTEDQNIVNVKLEVQYLIGDPKNYYLSINDGEAALRQATESALRHVVGGSLMDSVITVDREILALDVNTRLQSYLDIYNTGISVEAVNLKDVHPPKPVKAAFDDVIKAKEDETRLKNEAEAYSRGIIPEARGKAMRLREEANAYKEEVIRRSSGEAERFKKLLVEYKIAPEVTRQRLYLETVEHVLSHSSKVIMDVEGGNNLTYLPLDRIIGNRGGSISEMSLPNGVPSLSTQPEMGISESSSRSPRGGSYARREGR